MAARSKPSDIRFAHAGDLSTEEAIDLRWMEGCDGLRFQEIAIVGDQVIGSWQYEVQLKRGQYHIDSNHTGVMPRYRRRGVAQALWRQGIMRWHPRSIESTIGSDEGRSFLAYMTAWLAYAAPDVRLWVKKREEDKSLWVASCGDHAHDLLTKLGQDRRRTEKSPQKQLPTPKLEVVS